MSAGYTLLRGESLPPHVDSHRNCFPGRRSGQRRVHDRTYKSNVDPRDVETFRKNTTSIEEKILRGWDWSFDFDEKVGGNVDPVSVHWSDGLVFGGKVWSPTLSLVHWSKEVSLRSRGLESAPLVHWSKGVSLRSQGLVSDPFTRTLVRGG